MKANKDTCFSVHHGFRMNALPNALCNPQLKYLEERLIAANTPFMAQTNRKGWQKGIKGAIINVPKDLSQIMRRLPSEVAQEATILLHFKRRLTYSSAYSSQSIRPAVVIAAMTHLVTNCDLWRQWKYSLADMQAQIQNLPDATPPEESEDEPMDIDDPTQLEEDPAMLAKRHVEATQQTLVDSQH